MSLKPRRLQEVPEETAQIARAVFPKGNTYMMMRDELGILYEDEDFAALFPVVGQPAESPWRLALVLVMQFAENLTDRQAAEAVRARIDWKYALCLDLRDVGFDSSVLSEFRDRLIRGSAEEKLLDIMLKHFRTRGLVKARGRQRTDSTHVLAAIHVLNRLENVAQTLQQALESLAITAPDWLKGHIPKDWFDRYAKKIEEYRLPQGQAERQAFGEMIGVDGHALLTWVDDPAAPDGLRDLPAIHILRLLWQQQYEQQNGRLRWRNKDELPPSAERIASPYDIEARYSTKRSVTWVGYKLHLTETCDEDLPHLITHVETTPATEQDTDALPKIHQALDQHDLLPSEHIVDNGYSSGEVLADSQSQHQIDLLCPVSVNTSWQAKDPNAFDLSQFLIDWEAQQVTCPRGKVSQCWSPSRGYKGKPLIEVVFRQADCRPCPVRERCTHSKVSPREITLQPQEEFRALEAARQRQKTEPFKKRYAKRAGVEGTISQAAYAVHARRSRYIGLVKTHLQHILTAAAMNLLRVFAWFDERPLSKTRKSRFAALADAI